MSTFARVTLVEMGRRSTAPFVCIILLLNCVIALAAGTVELAPQPKYFRWDSGVAVGTSKLPANLENPGALRWRVPLDGGHSTPILQAGRIFVTTYRPESKELATVALDEGTGK